MRKNWIKITIFLLVFFSLSGYSPFAPKTVAAQLYLPLVLNSLGSCPVISNGDFEQGATVWKQTSKIGSPLILDANAFRTATHGVATPHGGSWAALLCGVENEVASLKQSISVAAGCPNLTFWHWIDSFAPSGVHFEKVLITNLNGTTLVDTYDLSSDTVTNGWERRSLSLSAYAGQTVTLEIRAECNTTDLSILLLDDFSF